MHHEVAQGGQAERIGDGDAQKEENQKA